MIALTFDDGPSIHTERILDLLERYNARATFFVVGNRVESRQDIVLRAVNLGSEIAGHSWAHCNFNRLSEEEIAENITATSAVIESVIGSSVNFFRPPFGAINERGSRVSYELGYAIVNWTADTQDWKYRNANTVFNAVMNLAEDGAVILLHDIHETTADAMELAIPALAARGYRLVTVSELLYHFYDELEPGRVYGRPGKVD
jgi:peptidoglycan/xylan/chitin deacetylase (PgdA/CDA1 family)